MNKLLITGCLLATAFAAVAMPTKKELAAAQKLVEDVIAPDVKALNAGRKTVKCPFLLAVGGVEMLLFESWIRVAACRSSRREARTTC